MPRKTHSRLARLAGPVLLAGWLAGCASTPEPPPQPDWTRAHRDTAGRLAERLAETPLEETALVVRLAFPVGVDLDLYVTDPRLETVYYANTPVDSGGRLLRDQRCDTPAEEGVRVEEIRFEVPPPGGYRIGVDHPEICEGGDDVVPYALAIDADGERRGLLGLTRWLRFQTIVLEFTLD